MRIEELARNHFPGWETRPRLDMAECSDAAACGRRPADAVKPEG
jgi:hypothetical protein